MTAILLTSSVVADNLEIPNIYGEQGNIVEIPILLNTSQNVQGIYTNITYNDTVISVLDVTPGDLEFESYQHVDNGTIGFAVVNVKGDELPRLKVVGTIIARILEKAQSFLSVNSYSIIGAENDDITVSLTDGGTSGIPPIVAFNENIDTTVIWSNTGLIDHSFNVELEIGGVLVNTENNIFLHHGETTTTILNVKIPNNPDIIGTYDLIVRITDDDKKVYDTYTTNITITPSRIPVLSASASISSVSFSVYNH